MAPDEVKILHHLLNEISHLRKAIDLIQSEIQNRPENTGDWISLKEYAKKAGVDYYKAYRRAIKGKIRTRPGHRKGENIEIHISEIDLLNNL